MQLNKETFVGLPFYIFITVLVSALAVSVTNNLVQTSTPQQAWLFIALVVVHLALYWLNIFLHQHSRWVWLYYALQAVVMIAIGQIPFSENIIGSLVIALIGEAMGIWGNSRRALGVGLGFGSLLTVLLLLRIPPTDVVSILAAISINGGFIIITLFLFNQQLAQRTRAEALLAELENANQQLEANAAKMESLTLETERQRMARELHDTLAQGVAGLVLQIEAIKANQQQGEDEKVKQLLNQALARARNTLSESRAAIEDLRGRQAVDFGEAIQARVAQFERTGKAAVDMNISLNKETKVPTHIQHHAKRVLAEALNNVEKHAGAKNVAVTLAQEGNRLHLEVNDNGKGFDPNVPPQEGHFGLMGLDERARLTQSEYTLTSKPGEGTQLRFIFPLDTQEKQHG